MTFLPKAFGNFNPRRSIHTLGKILLKTMYELDKINSEKAKVITKKDIRTQRIHCSLAYGTRHDKSIFALAINEMMTQIDNPRYVIIKKRRIRSKTFYNYSASYSVPKDISAKKDHAKLFATNLKRVKGNYAVVYVRSPEGREVLLKCKRRSRLSRRLIRVRSNKVYS